MKRDLDNFLIQWAQKKHRKPLLLRGARQTGKSYAVEKLAKLFPYFVCVNFKETLLWENSLFRILIRKELSAKSRQFSKRKLPLEKPFFFLTKFRTAHLP
jgi:hypothetical protein